MAEESRRYLVLIEIQGARMERLAEVVPRIQATISRISKEDFILAHRSVGGDVFSYLLRTTLKAPQIRARLTDSTDASTAHIFKIPEHETHPVLGSHDRVLVIEIGADFDTREFGNKIQPWLAHH